MESMVIKPDKNLKKLWFVGWTLLFIPLCIGDYLLISLLRDSEEKMIFGITLTSFLIIWLFVLPYISAFFRSLEYSINSDSISGKKGVFWKKTTTIPYYKITNIDITQGPLQRMYKISNIHCQTAGVAGPQGKKAELLMLGIRDFQGVKETIKSHISQISTTK